MLRRLIPVKRATTPPEKQKRERILELSEKIMCTAEHGSMNHTQVCKLPCKGDSRLLSDPRMTNDFCVGQWYWETDLM